MIQLAKSNNAGHSASSGLAQQRSRVLAIANQKGGVGKTTTAVNLATAMAATGKKALIIDLDPQGNASTGLGIEYTARDLTAYDLLLGEATFEDACQQTDIPRLSVVPSSVDLAGAELELIDLDEREFRLQNAVCRAQLHFDYVLIDCPPALGLLTLNALCAADAVLVPLQCEYYALEGLSHLVRTIDRVKRAFNPWKFRAWYLLCMIGVIIYPKWSQPTCASILVIRFIVRSFPVMLGCRRRHRTASQSWFTIGVALAAKLIFTWRVKCCSGKGKWYRDAGRRDKEARIGSGPLSSPGR